MKTSEVVLSVSNCRHSAVLSRPPLDTSVLINMAHNKSWDFFGFANKSSVRVNMSVDIQVEARKLLEIKKPFLGPAKHY